MKRIGILPIAVGAFAICAGALGLTLSGTFDLSWHTIDGGGATFVEGSGYSLGGTIAQPDAGPAGAMRGDGYTLTGGFWPAAQPPPPCNGDANGDGVVDFADILELIAAWGPCPQLGNACPGDFNGNGQVDFADILIVIAEWGCGAAANSVASLEQELEATVVTLDDWDAFLEVLEFGDPDEQENWICWMRRHLSDDPETVPFDCPGPDPLEAGIGQPGLGP